MTSHRDWEPGTVNYRGYGLWSSSVGTDVYAPDGLLLRAKAPLGEGESIVDFVIDSLPYNRPSVVLSYGLGVDSTAILLRWMLEPESRDFDLEDLVVVTAMTGDEWEQTGIDVEDHLLPLLREHRVRFVQVARGQRHVKTSGEGVVVLNDSRTPTRVYLGGDYSLSDEMLSAGTVPQTGGARLCSVHAKGDALDPVIRDLTEGLPYRHVIGFEANEPKRAEKDRGYNTDLRTGEYPLIEWGWDREACEAYITNTLGVAWEKSACVFCPFALSNKAGRTRVLKRYAETPSAGVETLFLEHVALALNPAQGLVGGKRAYDIVLEAGLSQVILELAERLGHVKHAIYEVRRILRPRKDDPTKMANAARSVRRMRVTGSRHEMLERLGLIGGIKRVGDDGILRNYLRERGEGFPMTEHFFVVAPAVVDDKEHEKFDQWWHDLTGAAA